MSNRNIKLSCCLMLIFSAGCLNTEGILEIRGKILDEDTKTALPERDVVVKGILIENNERKLIESGQFSTDSTGSFTFVLNKIKGVYRYNFGMVGDSAYPFTNTELSVGGLEYNRENVLLYMPGLTGLTIIINRKSKTPAYDTLALTWMSDGIYGRFLYPYRIFNYGKTARHNSENELRWIGGEVSSMVQARVFAGKMTRLSWDLDRYGRRLEFTDTITCKRDVSNFIYFTY